MRQSTKNITLAAVLALTSSAAMPALATTVAAIGQDGWYADDTRDATGANLVGSTLTHYGKPGQTATGADDTAIDSMLYFSTAPAVSDGALAFDKASISGGYSKASISKIDTAGFAASTGATSWADSFTADYRYYTNSTAETAILKIGVQSTAYATSQTGFTAQRTGESPWDLILVHYLPTPTANAWVDTGTIDHDSGTWWVFDQASNTYFDVIGAGTLGTTPSGMTLDQLAASNLGTYLFGDGAKVTSVQLGVGSSNQTSLSYIDYLNTSLINGGETTNFVPEPASLSLIGLGALGLLRRRRNA